jgi:hypothetical protein
MPSFNQQKPLLVCSKGNERGRTNNNGAAKIEAAIDVMLPTAANRVVTTLIAQCCWYALLPHPPYIHNNGVTVGFELF